MGLDPISLGLAAKSNKRINILNRTKPGQYRIVGNRGVVMGSYADVSGTSPAVTLLESRYRVWLHADCADIVLAYTNWKDNGNTAPSDGANSIAVRAAMELDASTYAGFGIASSFIPMSIWDQRNATLEPGATAYTDPVGVEFVEGEAFYARQAVSVTAGQAIPVGYGATLGGSSEVAYRSSNSAHQIYGIGGLAAGTNGLTTTNAYGPAAILGIPKTDKASVVVIGDSIAWGQGDSSTGDGVGGRGFMTRGLNLAVCPHTNLSRASKTPRLSIENDNWRSREFYRYATDVIFQLGINQVGPTPPDRQVAYLAADWRHAKMMGCRVHQSLVSCATTGTFADAAGQTVDSTFATNRAAVNALIISAYNAGLIDGYFDPGSAWEDPNNPGKFLPNATTDGTHPNATYHAAAALITRDYVNARILK